MCTQANARAQQYLTVDLVARNTTCVNELVAHSNLSAYDQCVNSFQQELLYLLFSLANAFGTDLTDVYAALGGNAIPPLFCISDVLQTIGGFLTTLPSYWYTLVN